MKRTKQMIMALVFVALILGTWVHAQASASMNYPVVISPPDSFFEKVREKDRDVAHEFYKKYINVKGMPVVAAGEVADLALRRTYEIVTHMLAGRPDSLMSNIWNKCSLWAKGDLQ